MSKPISILITGPECSGKSTLANELSRRIPSSILVDEFAREYLSALNSPYQKSNFEKIIEGQFKLEQSALETNTEYAILDTGPIVLSIWGEVKYQYSPANLLSWKDKSSYDFVFLCKPDFPWHSDPLREHQNQRDELFQLYEEKLNALNWNYSVLQGDAKTRLEMVLKTIQKLD